MESSVGYLGKKQAMGISVRRETRSPGRLIDL
jgi:hypothetical protein